MYLQIQFPFFDGSFHIWSHKVKRDTKEIIFLPKNTKENLGL
jgi:hypothetical protein